MYRVLLFQCIVYLIVAPLCASLYQIQTVYVWYVPFVFFVFYAIGGKFSIAGASDRKAMVVPKPKAIIYVITFTLIYIYVVLNNGLLVRRIGSDAIIEIYGGLSNLEFLIMRSYEIILVYMIFSFASLTSPQYKMTAFVGLATLGFGFLFTGALGSRAPFILLFIYYYIFMYQADSNVFSKQTINYALVVILAMLVYVVIGRIFAYDDFDYFFYTEFSRRLDGLELLSRVNETIDIGFFGTWDPEHFKYFQSAIPFTEAAAYLKSINKTATKTYIVEDVLFLGGDFNNSQLVDLFYFGGLLFVIMWGFLYGLINKSIDRVISSGRIYSSRFLTVLIFSYVTNFIYFELDFFGIWAGFAKSFVLIYVADILLFKRVRPEQISPQRIF